LLTVYRSNRAELLAQVLAAKLQLEPPGPFEQAQVIVNTWPTSRWLGEQIALNLEAGIAANLRFPFPGSQLRQLVEALLAGPDAPVAEGPDPWRASELVWPVLELLPRLVDQPEALPLRQWLQQRGPRRRAEPPGPAPVATGAGHRRWLRRLHPLPAGDGGGLVPR
jgi:exodeoxyribonuclease V gamma subunit